MHVKTRRNEEWREAGCVEISVGEHVYRITEQEANWSGIRIQSFTGYSNQLAALPQVGNAMVVVNLGEPFEQDA